MRHHCLLTRCALILGTPVRHESDASNARPIARITIRIRCINVMSTRAQQQHHFLDARLHWPCLGLPVFSCNVCDLYQIDARTCTRSRYHESFSCLARLNIGSDNAQHDEGLYIVEERLPRNVEMCRVRIYLKYGQMVAAAAEAVLLKRRRSCSRH